MQAWQIAIPFLGLLQRLACSSRSLGVVNRDSGKVLAYRGIISVAVLWLAISNLLFHECHAMVAAQAMPYAMTMACATQLFIDTLDCDSK